MARIEMNFAPHRIDFQDGEELAGMQIVRIPSWLMRRIAGSEDRLVLLAPEAAQQMRTLLADAPPTAIVAGEVKP